MTIPRAEYPRPQFVRERWLNLNGEWEFEFDFSKSGLERKFYESDAFTRRITVPFCPESALSGIGFTDFIPAVWYRKTVRLTAEQVSGTVILHFGAVDYRAVVFVNGAEAGTHVGGYGSFSFDISGLVREGENTIAVYAEDDTRSGKQPSGKQSVLLKSRGCSYTRTTGIWQTVWLEFAPKIYISKLRVWPNLNDCSVTVGVWISQSVYDATVSAEAYFGGKSTGGASASPDGGYASFTLALGEKYAWDVGAPNLYDLKLKLTTNAGVDEAESYFGLRSIAVADGALYLNGRPVFQRLVLDQGYYPDGVYTAPSDEALRKDIELSMSLGFNGARLHQKVFEERYLYHADKLGYLVWDEYANWGFDISTTAHIAHYLPEWLSVVERDFNHPALIGWCPFNETLEFERRRQDDDLLAVVYRATKALDATRPVIDTSGYHHVITDIYDIHDYEQSPVVFHERYDTLKKGEAYDPVKNRQHYGGQPYFVSEYGGARWDATGGAGWGYGDAPKTEAEFAERYAGLTGALLGSEAVCAFCYTQLYDVEQERNGLYTYDRKEKFGGEIYDKIRAANVAKAAVEK
jgi:beta-galactosidase/beta-glucuronidase